MFNEILRIEEDCLKTEEFSNLSIREMHVIEAVCVAGEEGEKNRATDIAQELRISAGTLTTAVSLLEKKGCLIRIQDTRDKRIVRLFATDKGKRANEAHQKFHANMVSDVLGALTKEEIESLVKGLISLEAFFNKYK